MKKTKYKCITCGASIIYNQVNEKFICSECKAEYTSELFKLGKKKSGRYRLKNTGILVAIIATLYLLWLTYRAFY